MARIGIRRWLVLKESPLEEYTGEPFTPKPIANPCAMELVLPSGKSITATIDMSDLATLEEATVINPRSRLAARR